MNEQRTLKKYTDNEEKYEEKEYIYNRTIEAYEKQSKITQTLAEGPTVLDPGTETGDTDENATILETSKLADSNTPRGSASSPEVATSSSGTITPASTTTHAMSTQNYNYGIKMPRFIFSGDIETFINRLEEFCITQNVDESRKANLILASLDEASFAAEN